MPVTRESWPQPRTRLRERPRALAACAVAGLVLVAASFGVGLAAGGGGPGGKDAAQVRQLKRTLTQQAQAAQTAQVSGNSLRTQNARLSRRASIQRTRANGWKRRYLTLRRSRNRRR